jgi:hypothetical protein
MDEGADRITQDMKEIVKTRVAIAEKLGAIEKHVGATMQHARTTMTQVANKTTSSVHETMEATKEALDPGVHAARHPWLFMGGALALGYGVGMLYRRGWRITSGVVLYYPRSAKSAPIMPKSGSPSSGQRQEAGVYPFYPPSGEADDARGKQSPTHRLTILGELEEALHDELEAVRGSFVRFGRGLIRQMVRQAVPGLIHIITGNPRERTPHFGSDPSHR